MPKLLTRVGDSLELDKNITHRERKNIIKTYFLTIKKAKNQI